MNTKSPSANKKNQIPIFLFEMNHAIKKFESLEFQLAQSEDERISVDHVSKALDPNSV